MRNKKNKGLFGLILMFFFLFAGSKEAMAYSVERLEMSASTVEAEPGQEVRININITKNPGVCGLKFDINYGEYLDLKKIVFNEAFEPYITAPEPYSHEQAISFVSPYEACKTTGTLATLIFNVDDTIEEDCFSDIVLNYYNEDIFDEELKRVPVYMVDGKVKITTAYMNDSISLDEKDGILTAKIDSSNKIKECGIVCVDKNMEAELDTPGRTRIVFDILPEIREFSLDISKMKEQKYRAYFITIGADGYDIIKYSENVIF